MCGSIAGNFISKLAQRHYESQYNPPRKPFDYYTAVALVRFMKYNDVDENMPRRRVFYSRKYGITLVSEGDTWDWTRESYVSRANRANTKPADGDSDFERNKKRTFELEFEVLRGLEQLPSLVVR